MNNRGKFLIVLMLFSALGCGYRLVGVGSVLPAYIKKIHIPYFINETPRFELEQRLTEHVQREFTTRGRLTLVDSWDIADAVLEASVTRFEVLPVGFNAQTQANRYLVTIEIKAKLLDTHTNRSLWESQNFVFRTEYESPEVIEDYYNQEIEAIEAIAENFSQTLVATITQGF